MNDSGREEPLGRLTVERTEGLPTDASALGCYVTVDGRLYDIVAPLALSTSDSVSIPPEGLLRLVVRMMGKEDRVISCLSIRIPLLSEGRSVWLPLTPGSECEEIVALPGEVQPPRLLVCRSSLSSPDRRGRAHSDPKLKVIDPVKSLQKDSQSNYILERQKMRLQKQNSVIEDLTQQLSNLRAFVSKQNEQELMWRRLFCSLKTATENAAKSCKQREETLTAALREVETKKKLLAEENMRLKQELVENESALFQSTEENSLLKAQLLVLGENGGGKGDKKSADTQRVAELERKLTDLQMATTKKETQTIAFLDLALVELFQQLPSPIGKVKDGVYSLGEERFSLAFHSGMLVVKAKSGFLLLSEFLKMRGVALPKHDEFIVEFPASRTLPVIRSVPSPIRHRTRSKPEQNSESAEDADSTFQTDISNLIQELDASNPLRMRTEPSPIHKNTRSPMRSKDKLRPVLRFDNKKKSCK